MATLASEMAKQKGMETRAAMESGIPGSSGTVRLDDLQANSGVPGPGGVDSEPGNPTTYMYSPGGQL